MQLVGFLVGILMSERAISSTLIKETRQIRCFNDAGFFFWPQRLVGSAIVVYITGLNVSTSRSKLKKNGPQLACRTSWRPLSWVSDGQSSTYTHRFRKIRDLSSICTNKKGVWEWNAWNMKMHKIRRAIFWKLQLPAEGRVIFTLTESVSLFKHRSTRTWTTILLSLKVVILRCTQARKPLSWVQTGIKI